MSPAALRLGETARDSSTSPAPRQRRLHRSDGESPTARLFTHDLRDLALYELLSILLEPGLGRTRAQGAAIRLLCAFAHGHTDGYLGRIVRASPAELCATGGLTRGAAARVAAALELGRRYVEEPAAEQPRITESRAVFERFRPRLGERGYTEFWVLVLGPRNEVVREACVGVSPGAQRLAHPREVLRPAILEGARGLVLIHNDPNGSQAPASTHYARPITARMSEAAAAVGLELWDHVVVRRDGYLSFREAGLLTTTDVSEPWLRPALPARVAESGTVP